MDFKIFESLLQQEDDSKTCQFITEHSENLVKEQSEIYPLLCEASTAVILKLKSVGIKLPNQRVKVLEAINSLTSDNGLQFSLHYLQVTFFILCFLLPCASSMPEISDCKTTKEIDLQPFKKIRETISALTNKTLLLNQWSQNQSCHLPSFSSSITESLLNDSFVKQNPNLFFMLEHQSKEIEVFVHNNSCFYTFSLGMLSKLEVTQKFANKDFKQLFSNSCLSFKKYSKLSLIKSFVLLRGHTFSCFHFCQSDVTCKTFSYSYATKTCNLYRNDGLISEQFASREVYGKRNCTPFYYNKLKHTHQCSFSNDLIPAHLKQHRCRDEFLYSKSKLLKQSQLIEDFEKLLFSLFSSKSRRHAEIDMSTLGTKILGLLADSVGNIPQFLTRKSNLLRLIQNNHKAIRQVILKIQQNLIGLSKFNDLKFISSEISKNKILQTYSCKNRNTSENKPWFIEIVDSLTFMDFLQCGGILIILCIQLVCLSWCCFKKIKIRNNKKPLTSSYLGVEKLEPPPHVALSESSFSTPRIELSEDSFSFPSPPNITVESEDIKGVIDTTLCHHIEEPSM